jgi:hypothetical protein
VVTLQAIEHLLLMDVDQHPTGNGLPEARAPNLARLKHHIAIGQDHRGSVGVQVLDDFKGARVKAINSWERSVCTVHQLQITRLCVDTLSVARRAMAQAAVSTGSNRAYSFLTTA